VVLHLRAQGLGEEDEHLSMLSWWSMPYLDSHITIILILIGLQQQLLLYVPFPGQPG